METGIAFGWCALGDPHFSLPELRSIVVNDTYVVERDLNWSPVPFGQLDRKP